MSGRVSLSVFDLSGRLVKRLIDSELPAGSHATTWDGRDERGHAVSAGPYFLKLAQNGSRLTSGVVVIR